MKLAFDRKGEMKLNQFYVYTNEPEKLTDIGEVYYPKIKMSYVMLLTNKLLHEVRSVEGVYDVRVCETGSVVI